MIKVICNEGCLKEIKLHEKVYKMERIGKIERHYLECPHCKKQYTSYYLNEEMKKIQAKIKRLRKKTYDIKTRNQMNRLIRKLTLMGETLKMEMEKGG